MTGQTTLDCFNALHFTLRKGLYFAGQSIRRALNWNSEYVFCSAESVRSFFIVSHCYRPSTELYPCPKVPISVPAAVCSM